jgi:hypothetical protein
MLIALRNASLYNFDGQTNTIQVNIDGINDIKYPVTNTHESRTDVIQPEANVSIRRGIARMTNKRGAIIK